MKKEEQTYTPYADSLMFAAENLVRACKEAIRKTYKNMGFKISHEEYIIIETIRLNPGIIQFDVSKKLFMQRSYVCKLLSKLEEAGYIRRENAIKGKRKTIMHLFLTEEGESIYNKIRDFINDWSAKYSEERLEKNSETASYLRSLTENIRKEHGIRL